MTVSTTTATGAQVLAKAVEQANARLALVLAYMRGLEVLR